MQSLKAINFKWLLPNNSVFIDKLLDIEELEGITEDNLTKEDIKVLLGLSFDESQKLINEFYSEIYYKENKIGYINGYLVNLNIANIDKYIDLAAYLDSYKDIVDLLYFLCDFKCNKELLKKQIVYIDYYVIDKEYIDRSYDILKKCILKTLRNIYNSFYKTNISIIINIKNKFNESVINYLSKTNMKYRKYSKHSKMTIGNEIIEGNVEGEFLFENIKLRV
ncbi:hypothetical protein P5F43_06545 [Clostridium perfringens]|uniref:hypothetical protein n=1 Tax=Clostridium perfringens TaxID=1502 RepID=UPI00156DD044|nr:hypothetical protein [Clostridium perfringens]EGT0690852.1 hypothetical protein [Clostridium perfringens]EGT0694010.1 hypothetical protein [Clostridium perfringens]EGT0697135.1 hypothetical protein [Clostridium perfringens]MBI6024455.1 hypothetical protein [Clostridium perfringens]MBI6048562.1 hypothetical protein [Clostridium perfringens]